jgi:hypothetical protein
MFDIGIGSGQPVVTVEEAPAAPGPSVDSGGPKSWSTPRVPGRLVSHGRAWQNADPAKVQSWRPASVTTSHHTSWERAVAYREPASLPDPWVPPELGATNIPNRFA